MEPFPRHENGVVTFDHRWGSRHLFVNEKRWIVKKFSYMGYFNWELKFLMKIPSRDFGGLRSSWVLFYEHDASRRWKSSSTASENCLYYLNGIVLFLKSANMLPVGRCQLRTPWHFAHSSPNALLENWRERKSEYPPQYTEPKYIAYGLWNVPRFEKRANQVDRPILLPALAVPNFCKFISASTNLKQSFHVHWGN